MTKTQYIKNLIKAILQGIGYSILLMAGVTIGLAALAGITAWIKGGLV
jgi:hypothetical protein